MPVKSPKRGHTLKQLRELKKSGFYNADTGTELDAEESQDYLHRLEEKRAHKMLNKTLKEMNGKTRSQGRAWIPKGQVVFRYINGHVVPFRKKNEPFL
jgi:hypothetical protein